MTTIRATFAVTTPMFLGGADQAGAAELRAPSFKGVLRFWWRACAWSHYEDLEAVRKKEECVFGGPTTGQSKVRLRLAGDLKPGALPEPESARYLAYGLLGTASEDPRSCLAPFTLVAELRTQLVGADLALIIQALQAMGTMGGLGGRSRRGFGSLSLSSLATEAGDEETTMETVVGTLFMGGAAGLPPYTAISAGSQVLRGPEKDSAVAALAAVGEVYKKFRKGFGRAPSTGGRRPRRPDGEFARLAGFGLPINLGEAGPVLKPVAHDRRASPLLFHIHAVGNRYRPVVAFLPATFLPEAASAVQLGTMRIPLTDIYEPVTEFLANLRENERYEPVGGAA